MRQTALLPRPAALRQRSQFGRSVSRTHDGLVLDHQTVAEAPPTRDAVARRRRVRASRSGSTVMPLSVFSLWNRAMISMTGARIERCPWARRPAGSAQGRSPTPGRSPRAAAARPTAGWDSARTRSPSPTAASISLARRWRSAVFSVEPPYSIGSSTLSSAVVRDSRLKPWNTKPIFLLRTPARSFFVIVDTSWPSRKYWPEVGRSRQPMMCMNVDLPEPDAPVTVMNSPRAMSRLMPRSALTWCSPTTKVLTRWRVEIAWTVMSGTLYS